MKSTRAVSRVLGYVLTLSITAVLVSGLLIAGGALIEDQREQVIETELQVIGEQVTSHINAADRLNQSSEGDQKIRISQPFPSDVSGTSYRLTIEEQESPVLRLETNRPEVSQEIPLRNTTAVEQSTTSGGTVVIEYDEDRDAVVIDDA